MKGILFLLEEKEDEASCLPVRLQQSPRPWTPDRGFRGSRGGLKAEGARRQDAGEVLEAGVCVANTSDQTWRNIMGGFLENHCGAALCVGQRGKRMERVWCSMKKKCGRGRRGGRNASAARRCCVLRDETRAEVCAVVEMWERRGGVSNPHRHAAKRHRGSGWRPAFPDPDPAAAAAAATAAAAAATAAAGAGRGGCKRTCFRHV